MESRQVSRASIRIERKGQQFGLATLLSCSITQREVDSYTYPLSTSPINLPTASRTTLAYCRLAPSPVRLAIALLSISADIALGVGQFLARAGGPRCLSPSFGGRVRGPAGAKKWSAPGRLTLSPPNQPCRTAPKARSLTRQRPRATPLAIPNAPQSDPTDVTRIQNARQTLEYVAKPVETSPKAPKVIRQAS